MSKLDDRIFTTIDPGGAEIALDPNAELSAVLDDLEALLKNGDVISALTSRGVNASLALTAASGIKAYLRGEREVAADDLATVAEEIRARSGSAAKA